MRIGLIIYGSLDTLSGGYLYDRRLVEYLRREGDQVEVISLPWRSYIPHLADNLAPDLHRRLAGLRVDLLLQDELNHPSLFWLNSRLRRQVRYPIVSIVHHLRSSEPRPAWQNRFYGAIERRYLESVGAFIFNSKTTRQVVRSVAGDGRPSLVAHPAGDRLDPAITAEEIAARARQPGPLRLFFLGNVIPRKGLHVLIAALRHLDDHAWHLSIGGDCASDPAYAARMMRQGHAANLSERIQFLGPLKERQLAAQLRTSHLLVLPSLYEGYGIAYLEGMSFGLPAVASTGGAAHEIITSGMNGFLVEPGDSRALARCLGTLLKDRRRLVDMSLNARHRFLTHPTWDQTTRRIRNFLSDLSTRSRDQHD
jgi:glycosyltransferase involved in cell wall biosynthesis